MEREADFFFAERATYEGVHMFYEGFHVTVSVLIIFLSYIYTNTCDQPL